MWRREAPHVLSTLLRRHGDFTTCEDAVQLALVAAAEQWPREGTPRNPAAWLTRVASRRAVDLLRADAARRDREERAAAREPGRASDPSDPVEPDDTLVLLMLCAHPALTTASQVALMLRAVGGLTTAQIAQCFFVEERTMGQRISRAKRTLADQGARFEAPTAADLPARLHAVRHAVAAVYAQDHALTERVRGTDPLLAAAALDLARRIHRLAPSDPENAGLLALLLLTHARAPARLDADGEIVPLAEQDRSRWSPPLIAEGIALIEAALLVGPVGPFQLQAAIAAVHAEAATMEDTDWEQILVLYGMLDAVEPAPSVTLGLAVATAEVSGPEAGLEILDRLPASSHRRQAVAGHLLSRLGRADEAREAFLRAAEGTRSLPEQRYLHRLAGAIRPV
ncbi:RNA polymerase sigma factor [Brachybacterium sp. NBEC-018]|uniref:RNA polymerase sigma factor n=1 Tax=Brachybacterium sp. NBEC-018 TaxID=2996004 RepID=UPI0021753927|nr:DUF6596 domain-containing protein [Brachybacterium sp. NBEC-018]UVY85167.1 RNA polymerase sigma factor [Brachybacterium sp. NBEC-018]